MDKCAECGDPAARGDRTCAACFAMPTPLTVARRGDVVVVAPDATLPPVCVRCGAETAEVDDASFRWHHPALYFGLAGGLLGYVPLALLFRKKRELNVPMCRPHVRRRVLIRYLGGGVVTAAVGATAVAAVTTTVHMWPILAGLVALDVSLLGAWLAAAPRASIRPIEITDRYARFAGACPAFLAALEQPRPHTAAVGSAGIRR